MLVTAGHHLKRFAPVGRGPARGDLSGAQPVALVARLEGGQSSRVRATPPWLDILLLLEPSLQERPTA